MERIFDIGEYGDRVRLEGGRIAIHRADGTQAFVPLGDVAVMMFSEPGLSVSTDRPFGCRSSPRFRGRRCRCGNACCRIPWSWKFPCRCMRRMTMWILVLFDLPTTTGLLRKAYERFRKALLKIGFEMFQKSVYLRWEDSDDSAETLRRRVLLQAPKEGQVTILLLTQRTWGNVQMMTDGCIRHPNEKPPSFLVFG